MTTPATNYVARTEKREGYGGPATQALKKREGYGGPATQALETRERYGHTQGSKKINASNEEQNQAILSFNDSEEPERETNKFPLFAALTTTAVLTAVGIFGIHKWNNMASQAKNLKVQVQNLSEQLAATSMELNQTRAKLSEAESLITSIGEMAKMPERLSFTNRFTGFMDKLTRWLKATNAASEEASMIATNSSEIIDNIGKIRQTFKALV